MRLLASLRRGVARHRVLSAAVVTASTVIALTAVAIAPASAATSGTLVSAASSRCLDVAGGRTPGTDLNIADCVPGAAQVWTLTDAGELRNANGLCVDAFAAGTVAGTRTVVWTCNNGPNQQWRLNANGSITGVQSGLCLDVFGAQTANGTPVALWTCNGQSNQRWTMSPTGGGSTDSVDPTAPGNARVSNLTCNSVVFSWDAATDNVGVTSYDIYHDGQHMTSVPATQRSITLTVVPGANWGLYVNARDAAGNISQASETVEITPPQCSVDSTPPTAPTGLRATLSGTTATLTWTASTDNVAVRAYDVFRNGTRVGSLTGTAASPPATTFADSGLSANTTYQYYVVARDVANTSARSNTVSVAVPNVGCSNPVCGVRVVTTDTDIPWGLVTLPDGNVLYAQRDAHHIIHLNPTTGAKIDLGRLEGVDSTEGEGGLLGLAISPSFATDRWLYIMHTSATDNRIIRMQVDIERRVLTGTQVLVSGIRRNKYHNGGRLRWGPDGKLYASTGDAQVAALAQDRTRLEGKILRINPDGSVPSDNPFGNYVWSYGHRNPQGIAFDSRGRLWEQEFGNSVMDETNLIVKGGNYGWPSCEGTTGSGCNTPGFIAPKRTYPTPQASCSGITIVRDVLYIACARGARMYRAQISGDSLTNVTQHFNDTYGRLRTVEPAPGGGLWLTTTTTGDKDSTANNSRERILHVTLGG